MGDYACAQRPPPSFFRFRRIGPTGLDERWSAGIIRGGDRLGRGIGRETRPVEDATRRPNSESSRPHRIAVGEELADRAETGVMMPGATVMDGIVRGRRGMTSGGANMASPHPWATGMASRFVRPRRLHQEVETLSGDHHGSEHAGEHESQKGVPCREHGSGQSAGKKPPKRRLITILWRPSRAVNFPTSGVHHGKAGPRIHLLLRVRLRTSG